MNRYSVIAQAIVESAAQHAKHLDGFSSHTVGEYVGSPHDDQLAGVRGTTGAPDRGR